MNNILSSGLKTLKIPYTTEILEKMNRYLFDILLYNPTLKLVGEREENEIVIRNFLDSLSIYDFFKENVKGGEECADLGTGAGFPGLLLAILFPNINFTLIERMKRRCGFLKGEVSLLSLQNVKVLEKDTSEIKNKYSLLLSRAFHSVLDTLESSSHLGKKFFMFKGRDENIKAEREECNGIFSFKEKIIKLTVPFLEEERSLLILDDVEKI